MPSAQERRVGGVEGGGLAGPPRLLWLSLNPLASSNCTGPFPAQERPGQTPALVSIMAARVDSKRVGQHRPMQHVVQRARGPSVQVMQGAQGGTALLHPPPQGAFSPRAGFHGSRARTAGAGRVGGAAATGHPFWATVPPPPGGQQGGGGLPGVWGGASVHRGSQHPAQGHGRQRGRIPDLPSRRVTWGGVPGIGRR